MKFGKNCLALISIGLISLLSACRSGPASPVQAPRPDPISDPALSDALLKVRGASLLYVLQYTNRPIEPGALVFVQASPEVVAELSSTAPPQQLKPLSEATYIKKRGVYVDRVDGPDAIVLRANVLSLSNTAASVLVTWNSGRNRVRSIALSLVPDLDRWVISRVVSDEEKNASAAAFKSPPSSAGDDFLLRNGVDPARVSGRSP
jgi:hypothetical protein